MGRAIYLLCEAATLYAIMVAATLIFLFFTGFHFNPDHLSGAQLGVIAFLIAMAPVSLVWATIGQHRNPERFWVARTAPIRPLAMILPTAIALAETGALPGIGGRQALRIAFASGAKLDSLDVTARLSEHLTSLGIAHSNVGGIHVHDGAASWRLDPVIGEDRLEGWIQATDPADRAAVMAAITDFLKQDLKLDVEMER